MSGWLLPSGAAGAERDLELVLLAHRVLHVGDHDGGDDAAFGLADGAALQARGAAGRAQGTASERGRRAVAAFAAGYLSLWILFSAFAVTAQWALERFSAMIGDDGAAERRDRGRPSHRRWPLSADALKESCLTHCRSPAAFLAAHWRGGTAGAWRMGLAHGAYCVGCCFALMLLLFVGGVMNLVWIAGLSVLVLAEKLVPQGERLTRGAWSADDDCGNRADGQRGREISASRTR